MSKKQSFIFEIPMFCILNKSFSFKIWWHYAINGKVAFWLYLLSKMYTRYETRLMDMKLLQNIIELEINSKSFSNFRLGKNFANRIWRLTPSIFLVQTSTQNKFLYTILTVSSDLMLWNTPCNSFQFPKNLKILYDFLNHLSKFPVFTVCNAGNVIKYVLKCL